MLFAKKNLKEHEVDEHLERLPILKAAFTRFNATKTQLDAITQTHGENIGSVRNLGGKV